MATAGRCSKELLRLACSMRIIRNFSRANLSSSSFCVLAPCFRHREIQQLLAPSTRMAFSSTTTSGSAVTGDPLSEECLTIKTVNGLHELTLPMVSRRERCRFTLQPFENTLGDLFNHIRQEDRAVDFLEAQNKDGEVLSITTSLESLLKRNFYLTVNDTRYFVQVDQTADQQQQQQQSTVNSTENARNLVASLYRTINLDKYYAIQHRQLLAEQTELLLKLEPMEKLKIQLERRAEKRTRVLSWIGLGLMGAQFGFMARLTWWEYSWDIMEPVTYFVGYATTIAMFAYYVITRQEYLFPRVKDREFLLTLHRRSRNYKFDINQYNQLRSQLARVERDLGRLRDPLEVQLMLPHIPPKACDN